MRDGFFLEQVELIYGSKARQAIGGIINQVAGQRAWPGMAVSA